jgi:hypothetical protein
MGYGAWARGVYFHVLLFQLGEDQLVLVADETEGAELVVVADQVAAPVAGADDGDFGLGVGHGWVFLFYFEPRRREACPELVEGDAKGRRFFLIGVADQEKVRRGAARDVFLASWRFHCPCLLPESQIPVSGYLAIPAPPMTNDPTS